MKKKTVALLMACVMIVGVAAGSTMAWLTDTTGEVTNTFTVGDIDITLDEADVDDSDNDPATDRDEANAYHFVPGETLPKDPKVTVEAGSEACYLFIKVEEINNNCTNLNGEIIQWTVRDQEPTANKNPENGWVKYEAAVSSSNTYYYYRIVDADTAKEGGSWYILTGKHDDDCQGTDSDCDCKFKNGYVTVNENVTKEMASASNANKPVLKFTAAAVQSDNLAENTDTQTALERVVKQLPEGFMN